MIKILSIIALTFYVIAMFCFSMAWIITYIEDLIKQNKDE